MTSEGAETSSRRRHRSEGDERDDLDRERKRRRDYDRNSRRHEDAHRHHSTREGSEGGSERRGEKLRRGQERRRSRSPEASRRRHRRDDREGREGREEADEREEGEERRGRDRREDHRQPEQERSDRRRRHELDESDREERQRRRRRDSSSAGSGGVAGGRSGGIAAVKKRGPLPDQADSFALEQHQGSEAAPPRKEKANYETTGALAAASNAVAQADGSVITLKYHEPPEARKPPARDEWRLFVFKDGAIVDTVALGTRSCWLVGREAAVVDLLAAHPSVSKQHAVLQFRYVERRNEYGDRIGRVRPYLLDLASANGTMLNGEAVAAQRFVELRERDMVQFGESTREYVLMLAKG